MGEQEPIQAVVFGGPYCGSVKPIPEGVQGSLWHIMWQPPTGEAEEHGYRARFNPMRQRWQLHWIGRYHGQERGRSIYTRVVPPGPGTGPS